MNELPMFVGPDEVALAVTLEDKLPDGGSLLEVSYKNGKKEVMSQKMFEEVVKGEATDLSTLRDNRIYPVVKQVLELLLSWGVRIDEMEYFVASLSNSVNSSMSAATKKLWDKELNERNLIDVDRILRKQTVDDVLTPPNGA